MSDTQTEMRGELMDGDGNEIGDATCAATIDGHRLILRGDVSMLIAAHRSDARLPGDEPTQFEEHVVMALPLSEIFGALGVAVTFADDLNGEEYVCTCDDSSACAACFDAAQLYVGKVIEDGQGRVWKVTETGSKDDWPTLDGDSYWCRPEDATVLGNR